MPFTFSHPAAVIPLKVLVRRLSFPALAFGSIAPDFEYFFRMKSRYSHTLGGIFWFDLPVTLALLFVFFLIVRKPLIENLPGALRRRFADTLLLDWTECFKRDWLIIYCSALLGSATHILWDSFTHAHGYFVEITPLLSYNLTDSFPVYRLLQHLSTVLGAAAISFFIYRLPEKDLPGKAKPSYWVLTAGIMAASFLILYFYVWKDFRSFWHTVIVFLSSFFFALTLASLIFRVKKVFSVDFSL